MGNLFSNEYVRVFIVLALGLTAIVYYNPIHTPCQSQIALYSIELKPLIKLYNKNLALCKERTDSGGCLPFFEVLVKFEVKLRALGNQCQVELNSDKITPAILSQSIELMVRAAWGIHAPPSYVYRNGWLSPQNVLLYCKFKQYYAHIKGQEALDGLVNRLLGDLPDGDKLDRTSVWNRSLLSEPCKYGL
jgi:hypothetical protein